MGLVFSGALFKPIRHCPEGHLKGYGLFMSRGYGAQEGRPCQFTLDTEQSRGTDTSMNALHPGDQKTQNVQ